MDLYQGITVLSLDPPFELTFSEDLDGNKCNTVIWVVYGLLYELGDGNGINIKKGGVNFTKHLTPRSHQRQLHIFAAQMTPHVTQFVARIVVAKSQGVPEPGSSSNFPAVKIAEP